MSTVPYSWYKKEDLQKLETSLKLELHAIMKVHGSDSPEFWEQHKELVAVQNELYGKHQRISSPAINQLVRESVHASEQTARNDRF